MTTRWKKPHFCPLDPMCREFGAPARLYFVAFGYSVTIACTPNAKIIELGDDMSKWNVKNAKWVSVRKMH